MKTTNEKIILTDKAGKKKKGRKITVCSVFDCSPEIIWDKLLDVDTLIEICKPKARFKSISDNMPDKWEENTTYTFLLFIYGFIPFGKHKILLEEINGSKKKIQSQESNKVVKIWNHLICMEKRDDKTLYTDIVELHAGVFTYFTALWSIGFYKHRQRKWQKIAKGSRRYVSVRCSLEQK